MSSRFVKNIDVKLSSVITIGELIPLLKDVDIDYIQHFPQFGVLFVDRLVTDLVQCLKKNGARFRLIHKGVRPAFVMGKL